MRSEAGEVSDSLAVPQQLDRNAGPLLNGEHEPEELKSACRELDGIFKALLSAIHETE